MIALPLVISLCLTFYIALLGSLIITPYIRRQAHRMDFVDRPDGRRKSHQGAIALGGGVAVLIATIVAAFHGLAVASAAGSPQVTDFATLKPLIGLLAAGLLIVAVGLIDDRISMPGRYKLVGQIAACLVLIFSGSTFDMISILGYRGELGVLAIPFSLLWLLAAINAINLIDGIDGLASTVGAVLCATLTALAVMQGYYPGAIVALALTGALLGFLRYNFAPASIFLGDSGSMLIGLVVGAVALNSSSKEAAAMSMAVPFAICAIPLLDSTAAILRRKLTGRSLFVTDRGHFHHSLLVRGWSVRQTVLLIGLMSAVTCVGALISFHFDHSYIAILTVLGMIALLIVTKTFGHIEFALVRDQVRDATSALTTRGRKARDHHESRICLQGSQQWDHLWTALTESAQRHNLAQVELTLNLPALHEGFFAKWKSTKSSCASWKSWRLASPLLVDGQNVGLISVVGPATDDASLAHVGEIADLLEPVEDELRTMIRRLNSAGAATAIKQDMPVDAEADHGEPVEAS